MPEPGNSVEKKTTSLGKWNECGQCCGSGFVLKKFESGSVWRDNKSGSRPYTVNEQKHAMAKRVGGLLITFKLTTDKLITKIYKLITYKKLFL